MYSPFVRKGKVPQCVFKFSSTPAAGAVWFKYATWNVRRLGEKEEELDKTLNFEIILKFQ